MQLIYKEKRKQEEEKEKEYLKSIAFLLSTHLISRREVANRNAPTQSEKQQQPVLSSPSEPKPVSLKYSSDSQLPEYCMSYLRTGACRFGYRCKHPHCIPKKSRGLLFHVF